ncbi:unnamed protein product [Nezara viridula]|uniref:Nuclear receptor corepressor 1 n=1 Tax=Nezara viridula TaxID=85310 RepID=A0A9P0EER1_NEZVI|nr:unnamed protein product [Nezara viridula]
MEAVVHLDRPATMPSQSQMSYSRTTGLHGRPNQNPERDVRSYKSNQPQQHIPVSSHNPGPYSGVSGSNYGSMRYIHPTPYAAPPPGATPVPYRDIYPSSRSSNLVSERAQNVDFVREQLKPRISLLTNADYLSSLSRNRLHQNENYRDQMGGPPSQTVDTPIKKIRLGEPKSDHQRSLRVDTRDDSQPAATYNPQVEAISPTLPSEALQEDANFRSTKDDLLHGIAKVDREITKTELQISKLKRKQQELEEAAKKPAIKKEEEEVPQPKHQSPAQKIYAENRRKAQDAHMLLANLGPTIHLPLYNQPSDTTIYHENKKKHIGFRKRLLDHLRKKHIDRELREKRLTTTYSHMVQEWLKKVEKIENSQKRKGKDAKNREYFEKIFPKLRKQREDRERFNRVGARVKSEADLEEIMDGLQEQEMEDKKMRSYAVVPPLLLDAKQRSIYYVNNNGRLEDFTADYKEKQLLNVWTQSEKEIFKEKYMQHPKNFGIIASYLDKKSVCDCVQYYYLSKKTENYKRLLRKSRLRQRSRNPQNKVNSGAVSTANLDILATASGVTTRLQREQLQKQEPLPSVATECDSHQPFLMDSTMLIPSEVKSEKKKDDSKEEKKKKEDEETTDDEPIDPIGGGDMDNVSGVACAVCKTESVCSRALPRSQASQYGLKEEEVPLDARVCNLCRCKAVRSRFTNCPIPTCPNAKGHRVKRLRPLPCKWADLPAAIKGPIAAEFKIDETVAKCCSACFNRISRRIAVSMDLNNSAPEDAQILSPGQCSLYLQWTDEEIESLKNAIKLHGMNWHEVSQAVGKSQHHCMNFFFNYQQKLGLDQLIPNEKINTDERKPVLTDEEESGSSTSSCDEVGATSGVGVAGDSDTASAPSPLQNAENVEQHLAESEDKIRTMNITPPLPQIVPEVREQTSHPEPLEHNQSTSSPQPKVSTASMPPTLYAAKEDYDSSATETADEGQGGGETESTNVRTASPKREDPSSPLTVKTVKDLMLGVIEMQLMKDQGGQVQTSNTPGAPPTISSILKTDHHNLSYSQRDKGSRQIDNSLATVSVVNTHHSHQQMQDISKEGLVVVQGIQPYDQTSECAEDRSHRWSASSDLSGRISQRFSDLPPVSCATMPMCNEDSIQGDKISKVQLSMREPRDTDGVTLDLSIKKPRENNLQPSKIQQHPISSQNTVFRVAQPPDQQVFFHQQALANTSLTPKLSPGVISGGNNPTATSKAQCGSIIHGTPVSSPNIYTQSRYESSSSSLIHQVPTPHKESGSITQGTPVHQRSSLYPNPEYFGKRNMPTTGYFSPRPPSYNVEQRQIIMNDYITSQQMHGPGNSSGPRSGRDKMYYQTNTRQGVIQRHNTKPPSPGVSHYPPGHEAFSSLVDVAVRQPSLPVPPTLSMPMEHKNMQDEKRHLHEGLGERFNRDSPHDRFSSRETDRYMRDSQKVLTPQQQSSSREQVQQQQQLREQVSHGARDNYQSSHHMDREVQLQQLQREQSMHREREHHSQQSQKLRESHMPHLELRRGQMPGYQPRLIHDGHHGIDQRLMQAPGFREQPSSSQSGSNLSSRGHPPQEQSNEQPSNRGRCTESSTLTAASLIDAIITHQINQTTSDVQTTTVPSGTTTAPQPQPTRPGDRLFQSFHKDCTESNGKLSPVKPQEGPKSHSVTPQSIQSPIIDHVDMYNNPPGAPQGMRPAMYPGFDQLRRALQQKDQNQALEKSDEHMTRFFSEAPVPLSPLDYVKNRIAEVMRTSEEESGANKDNESPVSTDIMQDEADHSAGHSTSSSFITPSHTYAYPFSALSLNTSGASTVPIASHSVTKTTESIPEPAPLLSAQYEPLSDED